MVAVSRSLAARHSAAAARLLVAAAAAALVVGVPDRVFRGSRATAPPTGCWLQPPSDGCGRRELAAAGLAAASSLLGPEGALSFENAIVKPPPGMRQPGAMPRELGLAPRSAGVDANNEFVGLKPCRAGTNCFSTTYEAFFEQGSGLEPWRFEGKSPRAAMKDVLDVVSTYRPGQSGIDGGGYEIKVTDLNYLYVQFESGKKGYIDDVEFALQPGTKGDAQEGRLLVRSSSRQGKYDYGVNALRLNAIAAELRKRGGWTAPAIDTTTHPGYWKQNCRTDKQKEQFPQFCP